MMRIIIFCEGQTEETFVRDVLTPYFQTQELYITPIIFLTSTGHRGGLSSYQKVKRQLEIKCKEDSTAIVTTLIDYYGLPTDWVGLYNDQTSKNIYEKIEIIEQLWHKDIDYQNFIPNLMLHEFEALLFSNPYKFTDWFEPEDVQNLIDEVNEFETPELINNSKQTAPSKRILRHFNGYQKPIHGSLIAQEIGLDEIRYKCQHFNSWIEKLLSIRR